MGLWRRSRRGREIARSDVALCERYSEAAAGVARAGRRRVGVLHHGVRDRCRVWAPLDELALVRRRLHERGMQLVVDFIPNHVAFDHPWIVEHPERFVAGTDELYRADPSAYRAVELPSGEVRIVACATDPYFPPWSDVAQLDYARPETRAAMLGRDCPARRPGGRRALRHGDARAVRRVRAHVGRSCAWLAPPASPSSGPRSGRQSPAFCCSPSATGTPSGASSSSASISPTTSGSTIACCTDPSTRCAATCGRRPTTRRARRASSRTTTSRGAPRRSAPARPRRPSRSATLPRSPFLPRRPVRRPPHPRAGAARRGAGRAGRRDAGGVL